MQSSEVNNTSRGSSAGDLLLPELLRPLAEQGVQVFVPLFVNTFPFAFHANLAGLKPQLSHWGERDRPLIEGAVNRGTPFLLCTYPLIAEEIRRRLADEGEAVVCETLSRYQLRRILARWRDEEVSHAPVSIERLDAAEFEVEVFSDTPPQADHVIKRLCELHRLDIGRVVKRYSEPMFGLPERSERGRVDLVVCSALAARYLRSTGHYAVVNTPDHLWADALSRSIFDLVAIIWVPRELPGLVVDEIRSSIRRYHSTFYESLLGAEPHDLEDIFECFQRTASGASPTHPLTDAEDLRHVLLDHHRAPEGEDDEPSRHPSHSAGISAGHLSEDSR